MENDWNSSPSRFDLNDHFVWTTKYRKRVLVGEVATRVRDLVREVCRTEEIDRLARAIFRSATKVVSEGLQSFAHDQASIPPASVGGFQL